MAKSCQLGKARNLFSNLLLLGQDSAFFQLPPNLSCQDLVLCLLSSCDRWRSSPFWDCRNINSAQARIFFLKATTNLLLQYSKILWQGVETDVEQSLLKGKLWSLHGAVETLWIGFSSGCSTAHICKLSSWFSHAGFFHNHLQHFLCACRKQHARIHQVSHPATGRCIRGENACWVKSPNDFNQWAQSHATGKIHCG